MATPKNRRSKVNKDIKPEDQIVDVSPLVSSESSEISSNTNASAKKNISIKSKTSSSKKQPFAAKGDGSSIKSLTQNKAFKGEFFSGIALGMIETRGLVPAIEAADAMTKAAEVNLIVKELVGGGYVTVMVRGETGAVNASVRAGADACERVGDGLIAAHIIARPHVEIEPVLKGSGATRRS